MASFAPPPGTADIFETEAKQWRILENAATRVFSRYGYGELRTPVFEYTEVFQKGLGGETEVVQKEMYTFSDRGGRSLTLRPEGTAGVMRALSNTDVLNGVEQRVYYYGPMFRGERPAAGRRRQFHQLGVENVGRCAPLIDAECLAMLQAFLTEIDIHDAEISINTRGTIADRAPAEAVLRDYFSSYVDEMCDDCKKRLAGNIWRILDCKQEQCKKIVSSAPDYLSEFGTESQEYFAEVCEALNQLKVPYRIDKQLVRGLDYYVHTVFEVTHRGLGEKIAIAGGGRYELYLPGEKKPIPGVGFAAGAERLLMVRDAKGINNSDIEKPELYLIGLTPLARIKNLTLANRLRSENMMVALELEERSFKAQMRAANRSGAKMALLRGEDELNKNIAVIKNMSDGTQCEISDNDLFEYINLQRNNK